METLACLRMIQYLHTSIFKIIHKPYIFQILPGLKDFSTLPPPFLRLPKAQSSGSGSDDVATAGGDKSITQWEMVEVEAKERAFSEGSALVPFEAVWRYIFLGELFGVWNKKKKQHKQVAKGTVKEDVWRMEWLWWLWLTWKKNLYNCTNLSCGRSSWEVWTCVNLLFENIWNLSVLDLTAETRPWLPHFVNSWVILGS